MSNTSTLPLDGVISQFFTHDAPTAIRDAIEQAGKGEVVNPSYPYAKVMKRKQYQPMMDGLQLELAKMQRWMQATGQRIAIVFEGRDAAGKGGTIKRFRENLNPRNARVVALSKPSDVERSQWYFQRYISHLPAAGEIVFFDRSWYNRAVVEKVFGFCTDEQREHFFKQVPSFEQMLANDGIRLIKIWLNVGRAEQLKRFLEREADVLKQWKLSSIDGQGLHRWDAYTQAITEMFERTHHAVSPWHVVRSDDKRRARIAVMQAVLGQLDYTGMSVSFVLTPDVNIAGGPEIME